MKCFAYLSHATRTEDAASLAQLAQQCAAFNTGVDVTGVLAYADGRFAQIVEGPRDGVDQVIARINDSRRHRDLTALGEGGIAARTFPDWRMHLLVEGAAADLHRAQAQPLLTPQQVDLVNRILLFLHWEKRPG